MSESATLDRGQEYLARMDPERKRLLDRIKSLEQQASGHETTAKGSETIARGLRGEIALLKRQAGIAT